MLGPRRRSLISSPMVAAASIFAVGFWMIFVVLAVYDVRGGTVLEQSVVPEQGGRAAQRSLADAMKSGWKNLAGTVADKFQAYEKGNPYFDQKAGFYLEKDENEDEGAAGDDATAEDGPGQGRSLTKSTQKTAVKPDEEDIIVKWERQFGGGRGAQHAHAVSSSVGRSKRAMRRHAAHRQLEKGGMGVAAHMPVADTLPATAGSAQTVAPVH